MKTLIVIICFFALVGCATESRFSPDMCRFSSELRCGDFIFTGGVAKIFVTPNEIMNDVAIRVSTPSCSIADQQVSELTANGPIEFACSSQQPIEGSITLDYTRADGTSHQATGSFKMTPQS